MSLIETLRSAVGPEGLLTGADIGPRYLNTRGHGDAGQPLCVVRPKTTEQVSRALALCHAQRQAVVPQGGLSGLVGGAAPRDGDVVLSLERMTAIEELDSDGRTLTAQAGVVLQTAQEHCAAAGFELPLDLGARGSATIGGVISTNAGGVRVIRYGMMRDSVLGLEAVLADGTVLSSMNKMLKNNAGYDIKQLFIGSEGTLGIVTRAVIRLRPRPRAAVTAFAGCATFDSVVALLRHVESQAGEGLGSFEVMWRAYDDFVRARCPSLKPPLPAGFEFSVLLELLGMDDARAAADMERVLESALAANIIGDAAIAKNERERAMFWAVRENAGEGFRTLGPLCTYDVSMPIPTMGQFGERVQAEIAARFAGATTLVLGHLGDGNLHVVAA
ncbi:MAG: FAD-binding oxidoreductase, partial [Rhodospirillaceae bacterium]|nr:FAD-binding oxidoreductase [Rhodospirillaceae bacterium]